MGVNTVELIKEINSALSRKRNKLDINAKDIIDSISQRMLENIHDLGEDIKEHYNNIVYNVDNGTAGIKRYDERSIIREIVQNIVDCDYLGDIKLKIAFNDANNEIIFQYNENGFKLSDTISFFSLEHTSKNENHTGAFGIGAKGALLNARYLKMQSQFINELNGCLRTNFMIATKTQSGKQTLEIMELDFKQCIDVKQCGTELIISLEDELYNDVKFNLKYIAGETKGKFITPLDFVFASTKKPDKNIVVEIENNIIEVKYHSEANQVHFTYDKVGAIFDVYSSEVSKYVYLFFYARIKCDIKPAYIKDYKYNYFSTYELIGSVNDIEENGIKFWINLPTLNNDGNPIITDDRTGIEPRQQYAVMQNIRNDCIKMLELYRDEKKLWFNSKKTYSYVLDQFYSVINKKFSDLKQKLFQSVYFVYSELDVKVWKRLDELIFINDSRENEALIKNIKEKYFVLTNEYYGRRSEYSKFDELYYSYKLYFGNKCFGEFVQCGEWERDTAEPVRKDMLVDILSQRILTSDASIYLMSAIEDKQFSEETLIKLVKACKDRKDIYFEFCTETQSIKVADLEFYIGFDIRKLESVKYSIELGNKRKGIDLFIKFICDSYIQQFHGTENILEVIKNYRKTSGLSFSFDENNILLVQVEVGDKQYILDRIPVESVEYSALVEAVGITNYRLLIDKKLDEKFRIVDSIENYCELDINIIRYYTNKSELTLTNFYVGDSDYDLGDKDIVIKINNDCIKGITENFQKKSFDYDNLAVYLFLPAKNKGGKRGKISIAKVASFLDVLWGTDCIKNLYRKAEKPITRLNAQIAYTMKPLVSISDTEITVIEEYLRYHTSKQEKKVKVFAEDINSKLFGYSSVCPLCGYESDSINAFLVREKIKYYENSKEFQISLYLCANEWYESDGWVLQKIGFMDNKGEYSIGFEEWIREIKKSKKIDKKRLKCKMYITKVYTNSLFEIENQVSNNLSFEKEMILSPALAVEWYSKNKEVVC